MTRDESFAALRAMLSEAKVNNGEMVSYRWRSSLCELLVQAHEEDKQAYDDVWLPYLSQQEGIWETPIKMCESLEEFALWATMAPFAYLTLRLPIEGIDDKGLKALTKSPDLAKVKALALLNNPIGDKGLKLLAQAPYLSQLEELELSEVGLGDKGDGIKAIANSPHLTNLEVLTISDSGLTNQGAEFLAQSKTLTQLRSLDLSFSSVGEEGVVAIAQSPLMKGLQSMGLASAMIGDGALEAIAASCPQGLKRINAPFNAIGDKGIEAIAASANTSQLEALLLSGNQVGAEGAKALAQSPHLSQLATLDLYGNQIGDEGAKALLASTQLTSLCSLSLGNNQIQIKAFEALAHKEGQIPAQSLDLSKNLLGDKSAQTLANQPQLAHLRALDLSENKVGAQKADAKQQHRRMQQCETLSLTFSSQTDATSRPEQKLDLSLNDMGDEDAGALLCTTYLSSVTTLDLSRNNITAKGLFAILNSPHIALQTLNISDNNIDDQIMTKLLATKGFSQLETLDLRANKLTKKSIDALVQAGPTQLVSLALSSNRLGDEGANALANATNLTHLHSLDISRCGIGDIGAKALAQESVLPHLRHLHCDGNQISQDIIEKLTKARKHIDTTTSAQGNKSAAVSSEDLASLLHHDTYSMSFAGAERILMMYQAHQDKGDPTTTYVEFTTHEEVTPIIEALGQLPTEGDIMVSFGPCDVLTLAAVKGQHLFAWVQWYDGRLKTENTAFYAGEEMHKQQEAALYQLLKRKLV